MIAAGDDHAPEHIAWMQLGPKRKSVTFLDNMWTKAAIHIFKTHKPNSAALSHAQHRLHPPHLRPRLHGQPHRPRLRGRLVGDLVKAVEDSGLRDSTTFIIATDHGFKKVTKIILPNVELKKAGLARASAPPSPPAMPTP
jgi:hypothetical protein